MTLPEQTPKARVNRKAIWSLAMGLTLLIPGISAGPIFGVIAITSGIYARREIKVPARNETGDALALSGITLGAVIVIQSMVVLFLAPDTP
ncbi:MAG: DUF4190 domain-containing protein [Actinomycetota bacterium]|nr:DUF4190 domain-containing protein [Actinomycetota bacterium]